MGWLALAAFGAVCGIYKDVALDLACSERPAEGLKIIFKNLLTSAQGRSKLVLGQQGRAKGSQ